MNTLFSLARGLSYVAICGIASRIGTTGTYGQKFGTGMLKFVRPVQPLSIKYPPKMKSDWKL